MQPAAFLDRQLEFVANCCCFLITVFHTIDRFAMFFSLKYDSPPSEDGGKSKGPTVR